ncbi:MAG: flagellin lysine-N-methylase [Bacillota bacterium]|nr:flagellin lysine-N-methylase [Bacillota bacterium]
MRYVWPDYYPAFSCIASRCQHSCCIGWEIDIDPETLARYRSMEGPMGDRLKTCISEEEDPHFILGKEERCPFLNQENLCDLILYGGEALLCQICTDHPRFRNFLPGRTELGVGLCCEAAAHLILTRKDPVRLLVSGEEDEGEGEELLALRQQALSIAQDRTKSIAQREEELLAQFQGWVPALSPGQWAEVYLGLERLDESWTGHLEALREEGDTLDLAAFAAYMADRQTEYEQLLVYFLYRHLLTAWEDGDPGSKVSFAVCSLRFLRLLGALHWQRHGEFTLKDQEEYARLYSAEVEYSQENLDFLFDSLM